MEQFANNADSTLNGAINNVTTTIVVADGSPFPSVGDFRLIIGSDPDTAELVRVTARSGNTLTVVRGQEGTSAQSWIDGTTVTHIVTAAALVSLRDALKGKNLHTSLETIGASQDGYALTWNNIDGYWAARPGSPFTVSGNELNTTRTLSVDSTGSFASSRGDGSAKLYVNGNILFNKMFAGEVGVQSQGFGYVSDALQTFTVPAGITQVFVKMWGPGGGSGNYSSGSGFSAGSGGYSSGYLSVTPGEVLQLAVGSGGKKSVSATGNGGLGGWPGGGNGGRGDASAGGGGGLTGIFTTSLTQGNALMIAGGGGGSSGYGGGGGGGAGGGLTGNQGTVGSAGRGGTQSAGGLNGNGTSSPAYSVGGALTGGSAFSDVTTSQSADSGGGGSGYFGGGAGQGDGVAGGGGSGYLHPSRVTGGATTTGNNGITSATGALPPNTTDPGYVTGVGVGGGVTGTGLNGGDGYIILQWGGRTTLDNSTLILGNNSTIAADATNLNISTIDSGNINLNPSSSIVTLQSASDFILSFANSLKFNTSGTTRFRIFSTGAIVVGETTSNDTSAEAQAGLTGPVINMGPITGGSQTSVTNQALLFNNAGAVTLQGHSGVTFRVGSTVAGFYDSNGIFRTGPSSNSTATLQGSTWPITGTDYLWSYNSSGSNWVEIIAGGSVHRAALQVLSNATSNTCGVSLFAGAPSHPTVEYAGNGIVEQSGNSTSALVFTKKNGTDGLSFASTGAIWQSGAWTIGRATNNDTSAEAQAGLTGPLLNLTQTTGGSLTTVANQALLYNAAGVVTLQGNAGHNFITGTTSIASTNSSKFITSLGRRLGVTTVGTNVTVPDGYHNIFVPTLTAGITITLPASPTAGDTYLIKDRDGSAATFNIIIDGNGKNIEQFSGAPSASLTLNQNYDSVTLIYNGTFWSII